MPAPGGCCSARVATVSIAALCLLIAASHHCHHHHHDLLPQFRAVRESFSMQREAFACADHHNAGMPLLPERVVLMSRVPEDQLLPTPGWQRVQPAGQAASATSSGSGAQAAAAAEVEKQQQQQESTNEGPPPDFIARYQQSAPAHVPIGAQSYNAPAPKRARPEDSSAAAAAPDGGGFDLAAYRALLRGPPQSPGADQGQPGTAAAAAQHPGGAHGSVGAESAASGHSSEGRPGSSAGAASASGDEQQQQQRDEAVRAFCVERRAR